MNCPMGCPMSCPMVVLWVVLWVVLCTACRLVHAICMRSDDVRFGYDVSTLDGNKNRNSKIMSKNLSPEPKTENSTCKHPSRPTQLETTCREEGEWMVIGMLIWWWLGGDWWLLLAIGPRIQMHAKLNSNDSHCDCNATAERVSSWLPEKFGHLRPL